MSSADVQNLNKLQLIKTKLGDIKLLVRYLDEAETDPVIAKVVTDMNGFSVSVTSAIALLEERTHGKSPSASTD